MSATSLPEPTLPANLRDSLLVKAEELEDLVQPPAREDERPGRQLTERQAQRWAWNRRIEDGVLDLVNLLPAGTEDYEARKLFEVLMELRRAIEADGGTTDELGHIALACAKMHDVLSRMSRAIEHTFLEDPRKAAKYLFENLAALSASEFTELLDVSTKTVGAWRRGGPIRMHPRRVQLVAQLCSYLRPAMTPIGILMWFRTSADLLDGRSPLALLQSGEPSPEAWTQLVGFARGARGQLAG
jgi:hypothetical protein